jgi:hypothetical protein
MSESEEKRSVAMSSDGKALPKELASAETAAFDPRAFDAVLARISGSASGGDIHRSLRRRLTNVVIDHGLCREGTFTAPFKLSMMELGSDQELRALTKLGKFTSVTTEDLDVESDELPESEDAVSSGQALGMVLAREAIYSVNDHRLAPHEKALLWEILGFGGRLVCGLTFIAHGTGMDPDLVGKSLNSVEVG